MDIKTASRNELQLRTKQLEQERKAIKAVIEKHRETERRATESGDGRGALATRKTIAITREQVERLRIEQNAVGKRLEQFVKNKPNAEKIKTQVERLHNRTASRHVNRVIRAQEAIVRNLKEIEVINDRLGDLATEYLVLCGEPLCPPTVTVPWVLREFARGITSSGSQEITHGLRSLEPYTFRRTR